MPIARWERPIIPRDHVTATTTTPETNGLVSNAMVTISIHCIGRPHGMDWCPLLSNPFHTNGSQTAAGRGSQRARENDRGFWGPFTTMTGRSSNHLEVRPCPAALPAAPNWSQRLELPPTRKPGAANGGCKRRRGSRNAHHICDGSDAFDFRNGFAELTLVGGKHNIARWVVRHMSRRKPLNHNYGAGSI